jgi:hypothetical protein
MSPTSVTDRPAADLTARDLRPLVGADVVVRSVFATLQGTLLSCVKDNAWLVVDDTDHVIPLRHILSVEPTAEARARRSGGRGDRASGQWTTR